MNHINSSVSSKRASSS